MVQVNPALCCTRTLIECVPSDISYFSFFTEVSTILLKNGLFNDCARISMRNLDKKKRINQFRMKNRWKNQVETPNIVTNVLNWPRKKQVNSGKPNGIFSL